jgi:hypothetical protein
MNKNKLFFIISLFVFSIALNHLILRAQLNQSNSGFSKETFVGALEENTDQKCFIDGHYDQQCNGLMDCSYTIATIFYLNQSGTQPYLSYATSPQMTNSTFVAFYREMISCSWFLVTVILLVFLLICVVVGFILIKHDTTKITIMCLIYVICIAVIIFTFVAHDDKPFGCWQNMITGFFALIFYSFFSIDVIKSNFDNNRIGFEMSP